MINKIEVYSSLPSVPILDFDDSDPIESDYIYVVNVEGLGPVKASISVMDSGARDGVNITGKSIPARNIVLTLHPNPDWDTWSPEALAQVIYAYFTPKNLVKLVFDSDEVGLVSIEGIIESCEPNRFSKDPEYQISIVCEDPYFVSVDPIVVTHPINLAGTWDNASSRQYIPIKGNIPVGFKLRLLPHSVDSYIFVQVRGAPDHLAPVTSVCHINYKAHTKIIELSSIPGDLHIRAIDSATGIFTNILDSMTELSNFPKLNPGDNYVSVMSVDNVDFSIPQTTPYNQVWWELTYNEQYGGI